MVRSCWPFGCERFLRQGSPAKLLTLSRAALRLGSLGRCRGTLLPYVLLLFASVSWLVLAAPDSVLPFQDDARRAIAEAKRRGAPLFVDAWAPWCHSCVSMQTFVFTDPALREMSERFVWLSLNTERPESAAFLERFPVEAWPTLLVLDPHTLEVRARWVGSLPAPELIQRLRRVLDQTSTAPEAEHPADVIVRHARAEESAGRRALAVDLYRRALALQPQGELRAEIVESLLALLQARTPRECAALAAQELDHLPSGARRMNAAADGLSCALAVSPPSPEQVREAERQVRLLVEHETPDLLADDRSSLYQLLVQSREALGDAAGARRVAQEWSIFLETTALAATSPAARAVFDAHRVLAYEAAGTLVRAIPMLEQSERELVRDYNPPARLARVFLKLGRPAEALAAAQRARMLVYGPRTVQVLLVQAEVLERLGRVAEARRSLHEAETLVARLPTGQRQTSDWKLLDDARQRLGL